MGSGLAWGLALVGVLASVRGMGSGLAWGLALVRVLALGLAGC